jgi:uncharacterized protein (TIGR00251 family)
MEIRLIPHASRDEVAGKTGDGRFRIKVQSPPVEGAANNRLVRFLSGILGVSKSKIRIIGGEKSRDKTLEIDGDELEIKSRMEKQVEQ